MMTFAPTVLRVKGRARRLGSCRSTTRRSRLARSLVSGNSLVLARRKDSCRAVSIRTEGRRRGLEATVRAERCQSLSGLRGPAGAGPRESGPRLLLDRPNFMADKPRAVWAAAHRPGRTRALTASRAASKTATTCSRDTVRTASRNSSRLWFRSSPVFVRTMWYYVAYERGTDANVNASRQVAGSPSVISNPGDELGRAGFAGRKGPQGVLAGSTAPR